MASLTCDLRLNRTTGQKQPYYRIAWREGKTQVKTALGFLSRIDAENAFATWQQLRLVGRENVPPKPSPTCARPVTPTLAEWWGPGTPWPDAPMRRAVMAMGIGAATRTVVDAARLWIVRELGDVRLDAVTPATADRLTNALRAAGRRSRTCQIYQAWLGRGLQVAADEGLLGMVPVLRAPRNVDAKLHRWLTPQQTAQLYAALDARVEAGLCDVASALAIRMQETLAMRPGEVRHRRWEDLRTDRLWTAGEIRIGPVAVEDATWRPKGGKARTVGVPPVLLERLRAYWLQRGQPTAGWIFPGVADRPLGSFRKALAHACLAAGVPELHPHALRHTGATRLAQNGIERRTLMAIGGWTSAETLDEVYSHTTDARVTAALVGAEVQGNTRVPFVPSDVPSRVPLEQVRGGQS